MQWCVLEWCFPFTVNLHIPITYCTGHMKICSAFRCKSKFFGPFTVKLGLYFWCFYPGVSKHMILNTKCSQQKLSQCARLGEWGHAQPCNLDMTEVEGCILRPLLLGIVDILCAVLEWQIMWKSKQVQLKLASYWG